MPTAIEKLQNITTGTITTMLLKKGIRRSWMAGAMPLGSGFVPIAAQLPRGVAEDVLSALVNLGYRRQEAQPAVASVIERLGETAGLDAVIRDSLKELAR